MASADRLEQFQRRHAEEAVDIGGAVWRYRRTGKRSPALLMLPGAQGTGDLFYETALRLGDRLDVITATYPAVADAERLADGVPGLLDALGLDRAHLLGSSLGGYVAQLVAARHAERVETLFLANTFCDPGVHQAASPTPEAFAKSDAPALMSGMLGRMLAAPEPTPAHGELKAALRALMGPVQTADTLKSRVLAVLLARPVPPLPIPDERIVLIDDDDDPSIPPPMRAQMRQGYAGAELHVLNGGGHYPAILRAADYARVIEERLLGPPAVTASALGETSNQS